ncbi:oligopeptide transporter subunit; ATP-binding component of ABC superfamily [Pseudodesulfovibrio profundus]|uniref:Oligopeptide transporter subunit ATP-binding component of ABC superfamily n=1 Tax=Pseudodesulfovibrio profundus TaxID=57320 RepID=A0A2C8F8P3_9BACT|nr:ABC transporter ATP-binding protein [Pseudodesulfovibrio profundus]SOB58795.1 oligopeptide transporter subunit; ATP-binding component of ABC superfamily [Pseudodesulfovibrio profundus]
MKSQQNSSLLQVRNIKVQFDSPAGMVRAVDDVSFDLGCGEKACLVGESGCGKTILALSLLRLLPPGAKISGQVLFRGDDLLALSERKMRRVRRRGMGMIFEQPSAYLNPLFPVGWQIAEAVRLSRGCGRHEANLRALRLLDMARIPEAKKRFRQFPHQLSGGMRQRVMVAMALAKDPVLLVADEPTTALDPTVRRSVLGLLLDCLEETGAALLCITHDWNAARRLCQTAAVMYAGQILELGPAAQVLNRPRHPYASALHRSMDGSCPEPIPGSPPALTDLPCGCRFQPRCSNSCETCCSIVPEFNGGVRCHNLQ